MKQIVITFEDGEVPPISDVSVESPEPELEAGALIYRVYGLEDNDAVSVTVGEQTQEDSGQPAYVEFAGLPVGEYSVEFDLPEKYVVPEDVVVSITKNTITSDQVSLEVDEGGEDDPVEDPVEDPIDDPVEDPVEDPVDDPVEDTENFVSTTQSRSEAQEQMEEAPLVEDTVMAQDKPRQRALREWVADLSQADVATNDLGDITYDTSVDADVDDLYPAWLSLKGSGGDRPVNRFIRFPDEDFTIDAFEGEDSVQFSLEDNQVRKAIKGNAGWWINFDLPGLDNPYHDNDNAKRKVMADAIVDLVELDRQREGKQFSRNLTVIVLRDNMLAFRYCADVLPDHVKYAFLETAYNFTTNIRGYPWINENMSAIGMSGLLMLWRMMDDVGGFEDEKDDVMALVRDSLYTEPDSDTPNKDSYGRHTTEDEGPKKVAGLVRPDGNWIENAGNHAIYNGIVMHYCHEGYNYVSEYSSWDFFGDMLERLAEFLTHQVFPDWEGQLRGPSMYSNREHEGTHKEESPNPGKYALVAQRHEAGHPFVGDLPAGNRKKTGSGADPVDAQQMKDDIKSRLDKTGWSKFESQLRDWRISNRWEPRNGSIVYDGYKDGTYDKLKDLRESGADSIKVPFNREEGFTRSKNDFLIHKGSYNGKEWGTLVELSEWSGMWGVGEQGLNAFWTREAGTPILSYRADYQQGGPEQPMSSLQLELSNGEGVDFHHKNFEEQVQKKHHETDNETFIEQILEKESIDNRVRADLLDNGVRMTTELTPLETKEYNDLYFKQPIYRGNGRNVFDESIGSDGYGTYEKMRTKVEYWTGSGWETLETDEHTTKYLRLSRDIGNGRSNVFIVLGESRGVKMGQEEEYTARKKWHARGRYRDLIIDLHGNPGTDRTLDSPVTLEYTLQVNSPV